MAGPSVFSLKLSCTHCRQAGFVAWESAGAGKADFPRLVFLSRGFHAESRRGRSGLPVIVCDVCDEIQEGLTGGQVH